MQSILRRQLEDLYYGKLFKEFEINKETGCLKNNPQIKFPTFPYIGSKYGCSKKILIVGLDIGSDETKGKIQSFEERRQAIEEKERKSLSWHNPHIAGTYFTALFFLKGDLNWQDCWDKLKDKPSCQKALINNQEELPLSNPLSYIALTNYYKFVSVGRENKAGGADRLHQAQESELNFFIKEVKIFNSDIIIFQSKCFGRKRRF